jgi:hypothetical protein
LTSFLDPSPTPVVFWFPLENGTTTRPPLPVPFTKDIPDELAPLAQTTLNHSSYGFFAQDEWKATPKLSVTLGLRYDFESYPEMFVQRRDLNNFQPRVGLAYSLSRRSVVRAGFGIYNDRLFSSIGQLLTTVQLGSAGNEPNAKVVFPEVAPVRALFIQPTVGGPLPLHPQSAARRPSDYNRKCGATGDVHLHLDRRCSYGSCCRRRRQSRLQAQHERNNAHSVH